MKKIEKSKKNNLFKKIFIKICRIIGFEIIDQSDFSSPTLGKSLNETLSIQGKKSITISSKLSGENRFTENWKKIVEKVYE